MKNKRFIFLIIMVIFFVLPSVTKAKVFIVSTQNEFQDALTTAASNNEDDVINVQKDIIVTSTLIYSGENGHTLIIDGNNHILNGSNSVRIMNINTINLSDDTYSDITIRDLIFQNGKSEEHCGGLCVTTKEASIILEKNTFNENYASWFGGGAYVHTKSGSVNLTNNTFSDNPSAEYGGGAYVYSGSGSVNLTNNIFSGNYSIIYGGGAYVYSRSGSVNLTNNIFSSNSSDDGGGANVSSNSGNITFSNNIFSGNSSNNGNGGGGGANVYSESGSITFSNNIFSGNYSINYGGGAIVYSGSGNVNLTNNTFSGNSAKKYGGGVYVKFYNYSTANIYNNIIWNNTANAGDNDGDDLYVVSKNNESDNAAIVKLYNNDLGVSSDFTGQSEDLMITYTDNYFHANNITKDPLLASDFHLQSTSPCIDAGTNTAPDIPSYDFEGDPRIIDGNGDGTATVDMGADEFYLDDGDGIDASIEAGAPNGGDGNGDGVPDSQQSNVTSLPSITGRGYITVELTDGCSQNGNVRSLAENPDDPGYIYPFGLVSFELQCTSATVRIYFHGISDLSGYVYRKYGPTTPGDPTTTTWYSLPGVTFGTANIGGHTVSYAEFTLRDGELGDDTTVDGKIVDQGGLAQPQATAVPTITEWGILLFALLAALGAVWQLRKKAM